MGIEIELKARIDDIPPIKERLFALGEYCGSFKKSDSYWVPANAHTQGITLPPAGLRIRRESGINANGMDYSSVLVTYKTKEIKSGIEVNNECEFSVSDAALFIELMGRLGLHRNICKEKEGWAWRVPEAEQAPILAELSQVSDLGCFLELEIIIAVDDSKTRPAEEIIDKSRMRLLELLEKLGIPQERIESRPYTVMLKNASA